MTRMTREQSREQTRERILESAQAIVAQRGYEGTSIADIAENAGYSKGAFFANFESKEALLLELLRRNKERDIAVLTDAIDSAKEGADVLFWLREYLNNLNAHSDCALLDIEMQLHARRSPTFAPSYYQVRDNNRQALGKLIGVLYKKANKPLPAPATDLADLFIAVVQGLTLQNVRDPGPMIRLMLEMLLGSGKAAPQKRAVGQLPVERRRAAPG